MIPIQTILVPTDFSEPAAAALRYARTLAEEFDSRLHLLHVVPEPYVYPWGTELTTLPLANLVAQSEQAAAEQLALLARDTGLPADRMVTRTAVGAPVDQILRHIAEHRVDLVVLGTHGRGMMEHLLLGSVAERVVRRSPVPVLTVHGVPDTAAMKAERMGGTTS